MRNSSDETSRSESSRLTRRERFELSGAEAICIIAAAVIIARLLGELTASSLVQKAVYVGVSAAAIIWILFGAAIRKLVKSE